MVWFLFRQMVVPHTTHVHIHAYHSKCWWETLQTRERHCDDDDDETYADTRIYLCLCTYACMSVKLISFPHHFQSARPWECVQMALEYIHELPGPFLVHVLQLLWSHILQRFAPNHVEKTKGNTTTTTEQHDIRRQWLAFSKISARVFAIFVTGETWF